MRHGYDSTGVGVEPSDATFRNDESPNDTQRATGKFWSTSFHLNQSRQYKEVQALSEVSASDAMARINRGIAFVRLHRFEDALKDLSAAVDAAPDNAHVHYNRALLFQRMGRPVEAERDLNAAVALKPTEAIFYTQRGAAVWNSNSVPGKMRLKDALSDYATALYLVEYQSRVFQ